jgi:hypothetical protein
MDEVEIKLLESAEGKAIKQKETLNFDKTLLIIIKNNVTD